MGRAIKTVTGSDSESGRQRRIFPDGRRGSHATIFLNFFEAKKT